MSVVYFVSKDGEFLGGFNSKTPEGGIVVSVPPSHGWQKYDLDNKEWLPLTSDQEDLIKDDD